ncbi:MAG: iron-containing alcohol dehydrogenase family protein [Clostridium sp.]|uniref:iron-containing alcohol dehydrogenase family protein n=2 Tax=Clostridium sp. TaxID=1506 RepID=UPI003216E84C
MYNPIFFMPTKIICEKNAVTNHGSIMTQLGNTALIVTGKNSSKLNGSLNHVLNCLTINNIKSYIFDDVEENPSTETINKIKSFGLNRNIDFIIGIGGGSPIDASKAAGVMLSNPNILIDELFSNGFLTSLPIVAIPTTAGTGTETTQYSILTDHSIKNKRGILPKIFPAISFLDASYLMNTPKNVTINTAIDSLSHLIEGYLSAASNHFSNTFAESGMSIFKECIPYIGEDNLTFDIREKLLIASSIAGMVISQSGTSIPHGMGYPLTYYHNIPHGKANGILLKEYLSIYNIHNKTKVNTILSLLNIKDLNAFGEFIENLLSTDIKISLSELEDYAKYMSSNEAKLKNHPYKLSYEDILKIYTNSIK